MNAITRTAHPAIPRPSAFAPDVVALAQHVPADRPLKIMVVHSSFTGGHKSAADSLAAALNELPHVQAESFNTLSLSSPELRDTQRAFYDLVSNRVPALRRVGFDLSIRGLPLASAVGNAVLDLKAALSPRVLQHIQEEQPDLIISTHSQASAMLNFWKQHGAIDAPIQSVLTDFLAHRMWKQDRMSRYYVASEAVKRDLERYGVPARKIAVTGIPVNPKLAQPGAPRKRLGLDPHLKTVLIMGGSLGDQKYAEIVRALNRSRYPMQIVAITARNQDAARALRATPSRHPLRVLGYVPNATDWMRAADVVVTKPGGLTASEVFALRKPMIIDHPAPGMEEKQAGRLARSGVAWKVDRPVALRARVERLLSDPAESQKVAQRMDAVSHPRAAYAVAEAAVRAAVRARG